ncbi:MAG: rhamnulokinase [Gemmatales bacterium]|nr:rhamnulokinase [Gemmatales bacterium]MDW8388192.1 rhamnulokinase family protein [Gemmatales bacterium]
MAKRVLAFDLGAESGRAIVASFDGARLDLDVVHRFRNGPVRVLDHLYWDVLRLFEEMKEGCRLAVGKHGVPASLGVDTWGVDFALLGRGDVLLGNPRHYRDPHTEGILEEAFRRVPRETIFRQTGIQFMRINSLFQLLALQRDRSPILEAAQHLLFMPDLFHFWFCGEKRNEYTDASTSQFLDPVTRTWAMQLWTDFQLPSGILGTLIEPGTRLGFLRNSVKQEIGVAEEIPVVVPATHDTAAAVAAVPARGRDWCYLSSGTWSLMGVETPRPVIDDRTLRYNFTNEGGVNGTTRLLKNIMGLWLVQECRRAWEREGRSYSYDDLVRMAEETPPRGPVVDPDDAAFLLPEHMPAAIAAFCRRTGQAEPQTPGAVIRCALESLALKYRWVLERLEELTGNRIQTIHIVGGGSQNRLLNQLTADVCNRLVLAGPVEATAAGNAVTQLMGLGELKSLEEAREIVRNSWPLATFEPKESQAWDKAYDHFVKLLPACTA